jgi:outer membrane protein OmpA-like peptidoglycan-associated protein
MSVQDQDEGARTALAVLMPLLLLLLGGVIGFGVHAAHKRPERSPPIMPPASQAYAAAESDPASAEDDARVMVHNGVVKFYFESGKADVAAAAAAVLPDVLKAAAGKTVVLSGFHDVTGNPQAHAELAKQRAQAVRDWLITAGVLSTAIHLEKPEQIPMGEPAEQARRVELRVR